MDCELIRDMLDGISQHAYAAKVLLGGGDTGREFSEALDAIEQRVADIREECYGIATPQPYGP